MFKKLFIEFTMFDIRKVVVGEPKHSNKNS